MKKINAIKKKNSKPFNDRGIIKKKLGGYLFIKIGTTFIAEHRLKCEEKIGRELTKEETVHHIDKNRLNNNINNLMLFKNQKEHAKFHVKMIRFPYFTGQMQRQIENRWEDFK